MRLIKALRKKGVKGRIIKISYSIKVPLDLKDKEKGHKIVTKKVFALKIGRHTLNLQFLERRLGKTIIRWKRLETVIENLKTLNLFCQ
jgi:hypothetical protein